MEARNPHWQRRLIRTPRTLADNRRRCQSLTAGTEQGADPENVDIMVQTWLLVQGIHSVTEAETGAGPEDAGHLEPFYRPSSIWEVRTMVAIDARMMGMGFRTDFRFVRMVGVEPIIMEAAGVKMEEKETRVSREQKQCTGKSMMAFTFRKRDHSTLTQVAGNKPCYLLASMRYRI